MMPKKYLLLSAALGLYAVNTLASDLDGPSTTFSSPINFCNVKAKEAITDLDKLSLSKVNEIKKLKEEINDLNANKALIGGFLKIRDDFKTSYDAIANQQLNHEKNLSNNVDQFKKLLKTSLTMSAVNLVAKAERPAKDSTESANYKSPETVAELCKVAKNTQTGFCKYINEKIWMYGEIQTLNQTLKNVNLALDNSQSPGAISSELETIYNSIPSPIAPDKILSDLTQKSPNLVSMLNESKDKATILKCLSNSDNDLSCKKLMQDPDARKSVKEIVISEMEDVHKDFSTKKFNDFYTSLDISAPKSKEKLIELINTKALETTTFLEKELNNSDGKLKDLGFKQSDLDNFKKACIKKPDFELDVNECEERALKIIGVFKRKDAENDKKLEVAIQKLSDVVNEDGTLESIEKMKQYVAQKYMRTCTNAKEKDIVSTITCPCLNDNEIATNLPGETSRIGQLNSRLSSIIGKLKTQNPISTQKGELGPFSKKELEVFSNHCRNTTIAKIAVAASVCKDIYAESSMIARQKESKEWDEFNNKYWVEYSRSSKDGFVAYEKKSNARIFGEGLSQSLNKVLPVWIGNFQLTSQIDMLTNQALYEKQIMYMNSYDSPWMNAAYFQGSYFPTTSYNLPTAGFNFGN